MYQGEVCGVCLMVRGRVKLRDRLTESLVYKGSFWPALLKTVRVESYSLETVGAGSTGMQVHLPGAALHHMVTTTVVRLTVGDDVTFSSPRIALQHTSNGRIGDANYGRPTITCPLS